MPNSDARCSTCFDWRMVSARKAFHYNIIVENQKGLAGWNGIFLICMEGIPPESITHTFVISIKKEDAKHESQTCSKVIVSEARRLGVVFQAIFKRPPCAVCTPGACPEWAACANGV